jgi:colanic acid/amylovoran biosynthesis glycosyltransferase
VKVAYFTNQYPAVSHTFIRREIRAVEAHGIMVIRYALRADKHLVDEEDKEEGLKTLYILQAGSIEILRCLFYLIVSRPLAVSRTLRDAIRLGWHSDRGVLRHFFYVIEAAVLARWCLRARIDHIHAHFGTNSAAIAMLASEISSIPFSFTVHGPEEFDKASVLGLAAKIRKCSFAVAISSFGRSQLCRYTAFESWDKLKVVRCGIDSALIESANEIPTASTRLVCVGRLSPQKGHLILIQAIRSLASRHHDFDVVLCGGGELLEPIQALIHRYELQKVVRVTGWVDGDTIRQELIAARALVLPRP